MAQTSFNIRDHYWNVGGDDEQHVFSSKRLELVQLPDSEYSNWLQVTGRPRATPIDSYDTLFTVLEARAPDLAAAVLHDWVAAGHLNPTRTRDALMDEGCAIVCTGTPAINGTYTIDQGSLINVLGVSLGITAGKGFPLGQPTFAYTDKDGHPHTFPNTDLFIEFAIALRDYVAALDATATILTGGGTASWPAQPTTIA